MAKNDFLARQRQREQDVFDAGMRIGRQQMCDYITLALRDPAMVRANLPEWCGGKITTMAQLEKAVAV